MSKNSKPRILSGIKPTGELTLGSYIGAVKNWVELSGEYDCLYMLADLHSITIRHDPACLRRRTTEQLALYIACGLDPEKNILFLQSQVPSHAQLCWVLNCYTMMGELSRMTQFKDKAAKKEENLNAGLYTYPVLMAADILIYNADLVPVGGDQKQHVEICRDIASRFNSLYGEVFTIPEPFIPKVGARIMSLANPLNKMSKSEDSAGSVQLLDSPDIIASKFKKAVTDSGSGVYYDAQNKKGISNLMTIYSSCAGKSFDEIESEFSGKGYGEFKLSVGEAVIETLRPIREKALKLMNDKAYLDGVLKRGREAASEIAVRTVDKVFKKVGFYK
ncbi:MAG: tryptophan--tRNA ligase [Eubacteriales bacterium]